VVDHADVEEVSGITPAVTMAQTLMTTLADREALALTVLEAASALRGKS
jgi:hypothetical protein